MYDGGVLLSSSTLIFCTDSVGTFEKLKLHCVSVVSFDEADLYSVFCIGSQWATCGPCFQHITRRPENKLTDLRVIY